MMDETNARTWPDRPYHLYGWQLSYFTGKTRSYLRRKGIPFVDHEVNAWMLMHRVPRKVGATVMPVVVTPGGEWLQDSTHIADVLDARFPEPNFLPVTPIQRIAARLLEAWFDEWWVPIAMHYRWSFPENLPLFEHDAGRALAPHCPAFLQRRMAWKVIRLLRGYLLDVGVVPEQTPLMERWTTATLDVLERHFTTMPYLFGTRPSIADCALMGPMYGHLARDPQPARMLVEPRPRLKAWVERMSRPASGSDTGGFVAGDAIPPTLLPLFERIFDEFYPMVEAIRDEALRVMPEQPLLPRSLGMIEFPMADGRFRRAAMPYSLWMIQRVQDDHAALGEGTRQSVDAALTGGRRSVTLNLGLRVEREALRVRARRADADTARRNRHGETPAVGLLSNVPPDES